MRLSLPRRRWMKVCMTKKIFILSTDEFIKTESDRKRFDCIRFPKICFVSRKETTYDWEIYLPEFKKKKQVGDCVKICSFVGKRIFEKHFDFVSWINKSYCTRQ